MADYQAMYSALFNKITDVIEDLKLIQQQTEEMHISAGAPSTSLIDVKGKNKE